MTILLSPCWTACSAATPAAQPVPVALEMTVSLRTGDSAQAADGVLRIGFEGVTADSRCPKGEQCVWAGDATVRIWLQRGSGPREVRELHAAMGIAKATNALDPDVRLVRLDPYPITGKVPGKQDYVATLLLMRGATVDAER